MLIGKKLKDLRQAEGLTQQSFADKLNISRTTYNRYENDSVRPDYEMLLKIADYYEISIDELFDRRKR